MDLIVETDCGHDPDDLFMLCHLVAAGVNLRCVTVTLATSINWQSFASFVSKSMAPPQQAD
jgi:hypothetical protein